MRSNRLKRFALEPGFHCDHGRGSDKAANQRTVKQVWAN